MDEILTIDGVKLTPLKQIYHPSGDIFHGMKISDIGYSGFEEAYFSTIKEGTIKAWKKHLQMTLNLIVPMGEISFIIFDDRGGSSSKGEFMEVKLSLNNYQRLTVPPGLWVGFKGIGEQTNLLLNIANMEHNPEEIERKEIEEIHYNFHI
jgi:dTDP-4-dehydrorhamnose 3,5-epimerase